MDLATGTVISERYAIEEAIGEGGMAVVYRARHTQLGTLHALKVLTLTSRAVRERLLQEGRVQAQLRHPNIVAVTDVVEIHGQPGLVMELVEGPGLDELIKQQGLTLEQADAIGRGILSGVAHAHAKGLIHRDLKPANVMLQLTPDGIVPKVTDFGLAKILEGDDLKARTRTGATMGTPQYMSPEQIQDSKSVDTRSDVFALGSILYELATGRRAFDGDNLLEIFARVADVDFVDPRSIRPDLPDRMVDAILAALVRDRDDRVQSCEELFRLWTAGEPMPAHSFSSEQLAAIARSMLPLSERGGSAPSVEPAEAETVPDSANTMAPAETQESTRSMAPTVIMGGGLMAVGLAVASVALLAAVGIAVWAMNRDPVVVEKKVFVDRHVEVASAPRSERDVPPAPADPEKRRAEDPTAVPSPDAGTPDAVPDAGTPDDPTPAEDTDLPDAPGLSTGEKGIPWDELPEEMRDPGYVPPEPVVAEPVAPEPAAPEPAVVPSPAGRPALPMSMRSSNSSLVRDTIDRARNDPAMAVHFITLFRTSEDVEIRKAAFVSLMHQWRNDIGDPGRLEQEAGRAIRSDITWIRWHGLETWEAKGTSLQPPTDALSHPDPKVRWLAVQAIAAVALRTGQKGEAGRILAGRAAVEDHKRVIKALEQATASLQ